MTDYVLAGIVTRRAVLTGEIEALHERLSKMLADLENVDRTIVQFDANFKVDPRSPRLGLQCRLLRCAETVPASNRRSQAEAG